MQPKEVNFPPVTLESKSSCTFLGGCAVTLQSVLSPSISQPFIMTYSGLTVSGCESCWWFQCVHSHGWQLQRS